MFRWLKPKRIAPIEAHAVPPFMTNIVKPLALAQAITDGTNRYLHRIASDALVVPAFERRNSNIAEIWEDTRIEVMTPLFKHGASQLSLLADIFKSGRLFNAF